MVVMWQENATGTALVTLATRTAIIIDSDHSTNLVGTALITKVNAHVYVRDLTTGEGPILIGMARGDATVAEIATALNQQHVQPKNPGDQSAMQNVFFESVVACFNQFPVINYEFKLGGGKGIPMQEGIGWQWFAYNLDSSSLTTGAAAGVQATLYGAWLSD